MNGGAVREERSPLKDAMDCKKVRSEYMLPGVFWGQRIITFRKLVHEVLLAAGIALASSLVAMMKYITYTVNSQNIQLQENKIK